MENYEAQFQRILHSIYEYSDKPALGTPPLYATLKIDSIPGLSKIDVAVLKLICETSLDLGVDWVTIDQFAASADRLGIAEDMVFDSIDVLADHYYIKGQRTLGSRGLDFFQVTTHGFEKFAAVFLPEFAQIVNSVLLAVVNRDLTYNDVLAKHLNQPLVVVNYALDVLENRRFIKVSKTLGGGVEVYQVTIPGRRAAGTI